MSFWEFFTRRKHPLPCDGDDCQVPRPDASRTHARDARSKQIDSDIEDRLDRIEKSLDMAIDNWKKKSEP